MEKPFYCLFFSFKGGVGRTSALMNTALFLVRKKKRVLIIDLDIFAPGVDIFDVTNEKLRKRIPSYHPGKCCSYFKSHSEKDKIRIYDPDFQVPVSGAPRGVVELCLEWQKSKENGFPQLPEIKLPKTILEDWGEERYVYRLPSHYLGDGDLLVMRAGNHDDPEFYTEKLPHLKISELDPGYSLSLKQRSLEVNPNTNDNTGKPAFIDVLQREIANKLQPDYVLVDCRPGVDWVTKLAMTWFSECAILAFNLNPWNLSGIISAYKQLINSPWQRKARNILLLATPIPRNAQTSKLYDNQYELIEKEMRDARNSGRGNEGGPIEVPYADILALRDVLITDVQSNDPAVGSYEQLGKLIIGGNPKDLENRIEAAYSEGDQEKIILAFQRLFREHRTEVSLFFEYGKHLFKLGRLQDSEKQLDEAWQMLKDEQLENAKESFSPYYQDTLFYLSKVKLALAKEFLIIIRRKSKDLWEQSEIDRQFDELKRVENELTNFIDLASDQGSGVTFPSIHALLGETYFLIAEIFHLQGKDEAERRNKLEQSIKEYKRAVKYEPTVALYSHGLGESKAHKALLSANDPEHFQDAINTFEDTIKKKSDSPETFLQLGRYHLALAVTSRNSRDNADFLPMPLFLPYVPYINDPDESARWLQRRKTEIDMAKLEKAEEHLSEAIRLRSHEFFANFNRGLVRLLMAANTLQEKRNKEENILPKSIRHLLNSSITDFDKTSLHEPQYSPSYFYSGMVQFFLADLEKIERKEKEENAPLQSIRFRQAFYRLEHFIDQQLETIVGREKTKKREPFYFDKEDIDEIEKQPFYFLYTLGNQMGFPPILEIIYPNVRQQSDIDFIKLIEKHL